MKLEIKNFRSIKGQVVELAPFTVVYGPNSSGKSSLLYALPTLKNIVLNSNQSTDAFFNYAFVNLGGFKGVVFDHDSRNQIGLGITLELEDMILTYQAAIQKGNEGSFSLLVQDYFDFEASFDLPVTFPYPAVQQTQHTIGNFSVTWNGIVARVDAPPEHREEADRLLTSLHEPVEMLRRVAIIPLKRGFYRPNYSPVSVPSIPVNEDDLASLLSNDKYLESRVSHYLEQTLQRDFRVHSPPGTGVFSLNATDKKTGVVSELVNEGFGINQLVYLFAMCLHSETGLVCVEEPEVHLHPAAVRAVAQAFVQIMRNEEKRFLISTHNESFVLALLALIAKGQLNPSEVAFYLAQKDKKSTEFGLQKVNEDGQLDGGLTSFMAGELEDIAAFFGMKE